MNPIVPITAIAIIILSIIDNYFFGNLMFLNFANLGILTDKWSCVIIVLAGMLLLTPDQQNIRYERKLSIMDKIIIAIAVIGTMQPKIMALALMQQILRKVFFSLLI